MNGPPSALVVGSLVVLLAVVAVDLWVYDDARRRAGQGRPVVVVLFGSWEIGTPVAWLAGCLLLWVFFVPLYVRARQDGGR